MRERLSGNREHAIVFSSSGRETSDRDPPELRILTNSTAQMLQGLGSTPD